MLEATSGAGCREVPLMDILIGGSKEEILIFRYGEAKVRVEEAVVVEVLDRMPVHAEAKIAVKLLVADRMVRVLLNGNVHVFGPLKAQDLHVEHLYPVGAGYGMIRALLIVTVKRLGFRVGLSWNNITGSKAVLTIIRRPLKKEQVVDNQIKEWMNRSLKLQEKCDIR